MCNSCLWGGITFPSFVGQSCCNPCCKSNGSVSGDSDSSNRKCCFCFDCTACSGGTVSGSTSSGTGSSCGCKCSGNVGGTSTGCGCSGCGSVGGTSTGCGCSSCGCGCRRCGS